ncbi:MAG: SIS domain-containing protein [Allosphingosinicella sp.]
MSTESAGLLEDADALRRRDPRGMLGSIAAFPEQMAKAWQLTRELALPEGHSTVRSAALVGMGGSAACGDLVRAIFSDRLRVPLVSVRDYELPAWVGEHTLVIAVSHSGATEETIAALGQALERRCPVAVITTGGPIGDVAAHVDLPRLIYANETPPRAALGYTLVLLSGLLERAGLLVLGEDEIREAILEARSVGASCAGEVPAASNLAKQLAWSMLDRLPVIEGSGFMAAVARRWKTQINENANSAAAAEELPEATHNTVVGYEQPETLRDHQYVLFLTSPADAPRNRERARLSSELLDASRIDHRRVSFEGRSRLAQACAAISLGDYVSFYLAMLYGVDPSVTESLALVKATMGEFDPSAEDESQAMPRTESGTDGSRRLM